MTIKENSKIILAVVSAALEGLAAEFAFLLHYYFTLPFFALAIFLEFRRIRAIVQEKS